MAALVVMTAAVLMPDAATAAKAGAAKPGKKVALVVGVQEYEVARLKLVNARLDATEFSKTLKQIGFKVHLVTDPSRAELGRVLAEFEADLEGADVGLFYYSGHGMQTVRAGSVEASNLLLPVDFRIPEATGRQLELELELQTSTVALEDVVKHLKQKARVGLVFLDARRDNPFAEDELKVAQAVMAEAPVSRRVSVTRGLSRTEVAASGGGTTLTKAQTAASKTPTGMVIAYATAPGETAEDGVGVHSPFTTALMKHIKTPRRTIEQVLRDVATDVHSSTAGQQRPWVSASLLGGDLFLVPPVSGVTQPAVAGRAAATLPGPTKAVSKLGTRSRVEGRSAGASSSSRRGGGGAVAARSSGRSAGSLPPGLGVGVGGGL